MQVLRLACSCLRNSPASDTWDLSTLLVNSSPVTSEVVTAVLEVLYSNLGPVEFEPERTAGQYSLAQLLDMLLFADAVGCSRQTINQLAGMLGNSVRAQLEFSTTGSSSGGSNDSSSSSSSRRRASTTAAEAPGSTDRIQLVTMQLNGAYTLKKDDNGILLLQWQDSRCVSMQRLSVQQLQQLLQQVCEQLEALLFVGFKLDLQQLLQPALRFLRNSRYFFLGNVVKATKNLIFSQRVLAAAGGASNAELLSRSYIQQPLGLGFGIGSVFGDVEYEKAEQGEVKNEISFSATLLCDLYEFSKGIRVEVTFDRDGDMMVEPVTSDNDDSNIEDNAGMRIYQYGIMLGPQLSFTC
jgi:hypothetical protein